MPWEQDAAAGNGGVNRGRDKRGQTAAAEQQWKQASSQQGAETDGEAREHAWHSMRRPPALRGGRGRRPAAARGQPPDVRQRNNLDVAADLDNAVPAIRAHQVAILASQLAWD